MQSVRMAHPSCFIKTQYLTPLLDTGEKKKELVMRLGAEKWIDFKESEDIIKDIQDATGGGPQAAVITAGDVSTRLNDSLVKRSLKGCLMVSFHSLVLSIKL